MANVYNLYRKAKANIDSQDIFEEEEQEEGGGKEIGRKRNADLFYQISRLTGTRADTARNLLYSKVTLKISWKKGLSSQ